MADEQLPLPPRIPERKWGGKHKDPARDKPKSRRALGLFLLTGFALAIVSAIVAFIFYFQRTPPAFFISFPIREYSAGAFPAPNAFVVQDGERLAQAFTGKQGNYEFQEKGQFIKVFDEIRARKTGPVIVHLCSLARYYQAPKDSKSKDDPKTGVYLLPADAKPADPKTWIPLKEMLDAMEQCPAANKLLILDVMRPAADVSVGILGDDVADHVDDELEAASPKFFVLAACAKGQRSHVSQELEASVFAHYLEKGLRGKADGFGPKGNKGDRRISVHELADYAKTLVNRWVGVNRGARQTPRLWGNAADFSVAQIGGVEHEPTNAEEAELVYPKWLEDAWKIRDKLEADAAHRVAPRLFRQLENEILRFEKLWRAGADKNKDIQTDLEREVKKREGEIRRAFEPPPRRMLSLAELPRLESEAILADSRETLRFLKAVPEPVAKADEGDKLRAIEFAKFKIELAEKLKKHAFETAALMIADAVKEFPVLTPEKILAVNQLLRELDPSREKRYVETVFLDRLKEMVLMIRDAGPEREKEWPPDAVQLAFKLASQAESLLADFRGDPELLNPWSFEVSRKADDDAAAVRPADSRIKSDWNLAIFEKAEKHRRDAERELFDENSEWKGILGKLREAEKIYQRVLPARVAILKEMKRDRDLAYVHLAGWQPFLVAVGRLDPREDSAWKGCAEAAEQLAGLLDQPSPEYLDGEPSPLLKWRDQSAEWRRSVDARLKRMDDMRKKIEFQDYLDAQALLESPRLTAAQRKMIWTNARTIGKKLHEAAVQAEDDAREPLADDPTAKQEIDRRRRRVDLFAQLVRLTPLDLPDELREKRDDASWQALGDGLRRIAMKDIPKQYSEWVKIDRIKADRLSRVFSGGELDAPGAGSESRNPTARIRDDRRAAIGLWMRERYNREAEPLKPAHADFYRSAAREFD